eukprot:5833197-Alexandrium_andersonii.AAC.1
MSTSPATASLVAAAGIARGSEPCGASGLGAAGCPGGLPAASGPTCIILRPRFLASTGGVGP